ncbi:MAG: bacterial Ig-like domain-containing protein, partial [Clostridia bacterium]|nr:bacterial Ig-like domain-containing protein [Clostridia bacterium]
YQKDANAPIVSSSTPPTKVDTKAAPTGYHFEKAYSIAAGDQVVLVCEDAKKEMTAISTTSTKYGVGTDYSDEESPLPLAGSFMFTVEAGSESETFAFKNGSNYLRWDSGNSLDTGATSVAKNSSWSLDFDEDGNILFANANNTSRQLWWNSGSPRFACYTGKASDNAYYYVQLYKLVADKKAVTSIEIVGTPSKTTYNVGEAYSAAGLSVRATYEGGSQETVTATIEPSKQYAEAGDTSVTFSASYEGKTASLPVNVTVNSVYSNVSFKFNFKNTGMDALVSEYGDAFDDIGLVVEYGGRTRYFSFIPDDKGNYYIYEDGEDPTTFKMKDGGVFTMSLGDVINNLDRAATEFTVKAYIKDGENYYYSSNSTTYSVMSWISYYHSKSDYKDAVEDLYNIFFPNAQ